MLKFIEEDKIIMLLQIITDKQEYVFIFQPLEETCEVFFEEKDQAVNIRQRHKIYTGYLKIGYYNDIDNITNFLTYQQKCQRFYDSILKDNLDILRIKIYLIHSNEIQNNILENYDSNNFSLKNSLDNYLDYLVFDSNGRSISPSSFYSNRNRRVLFTGFFFYLDGISEQLGIESSDRRMRWIL